MLARVAASFYWMGRHLERAEQTARLLEHQLIRLVDRRAADVASGWQAAYRALGQPSPPVESDADAAETFLIADAYTLAGILVEETSNPDSIVSCWGVARENARQVRAHLPKSIWTCLNLGYLWMRDTDFAAAWARGPSALVGEASERLRLLAGMVESEMCRDEGWRFLELGRFIERIQHHASLLGTWVNLGSEDPELEALLWGDLLRVCGAYEIYCRRESMEVQPERVLVLLVRDPDIPRSLRFSVEWLNVILAGVDPVGARHPLAPPHRMALRLAATIEVETFGGSDARTAQAFFRRVGSESRELHSRVISQYADYPSVEGLPA